MDKVHCFTSLRPTAYPLPAYNLPPCRSSCLPSPPLSGDGPVAPLRAAEPQLHAQHHQLPTQVRLRGTAAAVWWQVVGVLLSGTWSYQGTRGRYGRCSPKAALQVSIHVMFHLNSCGDCKPLDPPASYHHALRINQELKHLVVQPSPLDNDHPEPQPPPLTLAIMSFHFGLCQGYADYAC